MTEAIFLVLGLAGGAVAGWLVARAVVRAAMQGDLAEVQGQASALEGTIGELRTQAAKLEELAGELQAALDAERQARVKAETQLTEAERRMQEERALLDDARKALTETFKALSNDALKSNNQAFLELARESLDKVVSDAKGELGKRQEAISGLVKPLGDVLKQYQEHLSSFEKSGKETYGSLREQIQTLSGASQQLQQETGKLVNALRKPQVRGRWGELTLHKVVELAGMSQHVDYVEQQTVDTEEGRLRPDLIVHLPGRRDIIVDSKVPLEAYLDALEADTEEEREAHLTRHARQVRTHMKQLASKSYWKEFEQSADFVVMFIPGEPFFAAAADRDGSIIEDAMQEKVVLTTPSTFIALLRAVHYGWRQEQLTENARQISDIGKELYRRMSTLNEHFTKLGKAISSVNEYYNNSIRSLETRILPQIRRFKDLGATEANDIPTLEPVEQAPRTLNVPELTGEGEETDLSPDGP